VSLSFWTPFKIGEWEWTCRVHCAKVTKHCPFNGNRIRACRIVNKKVWHYSQRFDPLAAAMWASAAQYVAVELPDAPKEAIFWLRFADVESDFFGKPIAREPRAYCGYRGWETVHG
jgi:hypothetical protein